MTTCSTESGAHTRARSGVRTRRGAVVRKRAHTRVTALAGVLAAVFFLACAGQRIGDPSAYAPVTLNRVFPYPSEQELAGQKIEVVLAAQYTDELPRERVGTTTTGLLAVVDRYLSQAGAGVIDRSIHDLETVRDELEAAERRRGINGFTGADWAIVARTDKFRHWSEYVPPSSLFKNEEELQQDPGTCKHYGEVEARLRAFEIPTDDVAQATYTLRHADMFEESQFDQSCPLDGTRELIFLEDVLKEALPCLEVPLKNGFAPIGYIEEHRIDADAGKHIYRTSMGEKDGALPGLELEIYRVQFMTTRDDERIRDERLMGHAVVTEQIGKSHSWILVDQADLSQSILAGDLVRAVYSDSQWSALGTGLCKRALVVHGAP